MNIHIIQHESFESPAAVETWARDRKHGISYTRLYRNEQFPDEIDDFDFIIIMGGPQSPATTEEECPHFDGPGETAFIKRAIEEKIIVLGICLGAQMIGAALGAGFAHSPQREIGVFDITLTAEGRKDAFFSTLPEIFPVGHWHGDMPGLTSDSQVFAESEGCPRQIIRYSPKVYGLQCHMEFTPEAIEGMIQNNSDELDEYKDHPYVQDVQTLRSHDYGPMNGILFQFLDYLAAP